MSSAVATQSLDIAGRQLLIGGAWRLADSPADVKAVRSRLQPGGLVFELLHTSDRSVVVYARPKRLKKNAASGGAIVATLVPNVFVCHHLDAATVWVFAAVNGHPLPGFDKVVRQSEVVQILAEARLSGQELKLIGDDPAADMTLANLLGGADAASWSSASLKTRNPWISPALGALSCGVVVAIYFYLSGRAPEQVAVVAPVVPAPAVVRPPLAPASVPASAVEVPPAEPVRFSASSAIREALSTVRELPVSVKGWVPTSAVCRVSTSECVISWTSTPGSLPESAKFIPGVELSLESALGKQVKSHLRIDFKPSGRIVMLDEGRLLSFYSLDTNLLSSPVPYTVSVRRAERSNGPRGQQVVGIDAYGPLWAWEKIVEALDISTVTLDEVTLSQITTSDPQLRLAGTAYALPASQQH
ncbi:hypothetical protein [Paucibacter soli]|uniref:hypothetical protein n=1 Tax=Paucibacter soli TaxID=3133433 RepID=UPI0030A64271